VTAVGAPPDVLFGINGMGPSAAAGGPILFGGWRGTARGAKIPAMIDLEFADEILGQLRDRNPRFTGKAYVFVLSALHAVMERLDRPRHISGQELVGGVRELALARFGPLARTVLEHWGIRRTEDVGEIVFALVDCGILMKQEEDSAEDFRNLFDFQEAFERDYPWGVGIGPGPLEG
jgi:uncharacterized repeat protein (TIGR04138 family)